MKILLHGASSWIGQTLGIEMSRHPEFEISGTYRNREPLGVTFPTLRAENKEHHAIGEFIDQHKPEVLVHLARGEDKASFILLEKLVQIFDQTGGHLVYCSSANALDQRQGPYHEDDRPDAKSEYGRFKSRCEQLLRKHSDRFSILRFSAIHGWAPNRISRTEHLLRQWKAGRKTPSHTQVIQNHHAVENLVQDMIDIVRDRKTGTFHLGPSDASSDFDFACKLAERFGYEKDLVEEESKERENFHLVGSSTYKESDTLDRIEMSHNLQKYRKN